MNDLSRQLHIKSIDLLTIKLKDEKERLKSKRVEHGYTYNLRKICLINDFLRNY